MTGGDASRVEWVSGALIVPMRKVGAVTRGGVLRAEGGVVEQSLLRRGEDGIGIHAPEAQRPRAFRAGAHIYGGFLLPHYGHFLLEGCARLWAAREYPDRSVIWAGGAPVTGLIESVFGLLGLRNAHIVTRVPTTVEELAVPEPGFRIRGYCRPEFVAAMGQVACAAEPGLKVWLSRSGLTATQRRRMAGEDALERQLAAAGWLIFRPEKHPIADQVKLYARASEIAGLTGSAFHTLVLLKDFRGRVTLFQATEARSISNYEMIAVAKGLDQTTVAVPGLVRPAQPGPPLLSRESEAAILAALGVRSGPAEPAAQDTQRTEHDQSATAG